MVVELAPPDMLLPVIKHHALVSVVLLMNVMQEEALLLFTGIKFAKVNVVIIGTGL